MSPAVELRPVAPADLPFLAGVYASTREEELAAAPWTPEQKQEFLRWQFELQHRFYTERFPSTEFRVVFVDGAPAGRLYVDRRADELRIVDVALLPEYRGRGIGSRLVRDVIARAEAAGLAVRIHVEIHNHRARALYERLGFHAVAGHGLYLLMERPDLSGGTGSARPGA
jgi:ribosomal protein S18 acetylase RimI-like enzyme